MPRFGHYSKAFHELGSSSFGKAPALAGPNPARLHIGDSHLPPTHHIDLDANFTARHPYWFRYPSTRGQGRLREAIANFYESTHEIETRPEEIQITLGATGALQGLLTLLTDEDDEVLVTTPAWPLILGMVRLSRARLVEVPLYHRLRGLSAEEVERTLEEAITPRTSVLYVNSPNNPTGAILDAAQRSAVMEVARRHDLWVLSDEAYDGMAYDGHETPTLAGEDEDGRVVVVSTFSKIHRAAGLRLGWACASEDVIVALDRILTHQAYSASALSQTLMVEPMRTRAEWVEEVVQGFRRQRDLFVKVLDLPVSTPAGAYFCFIDLEALGSGPTDEVIAAAAADGIGVTAGSEFGTGFERFIRVCYACEDRETLARAARSLRKILFPKKSP